MQKNWSSFNISTLMEIPAYHLGQQIQSKSPEYQKEAESKKTRTCFSRAQVAILEERFKVQKYITQTERIQLAEQLCMTDNQVKTWFQNRRTKWRRQEADTNYVKQPMDMEKRFEYSEIKNN